MKKYNVIVDGMKYKDSYFIRTMDEYKLYVKLLNNKFHVSADEIKNLKQFMGTR